MVRRLIEVDFHNRSRRPSQGQIQFWLREARTPGLLVELCRRYPGMARRISGVRPAVRWAMKGNLPRIDAELRRGRLSPGRRPGLLAASASRAFQLAAEWNEEGIRREEGTVHGTRLPWHTAANPLSGLASERSRCVWTTAGPSLAHRARESRRFRISRLGFSPPTEAPPSVLYPPHTAARAAGTMRYSSCTPASEASHDVP